MYMEFDHLNDEIRLISTQVPYCLGTYVPIYIYGKLAAILMMANWKCKSGQFGLLCDPQ